MIAAVVQARIGSTRLPGKTLADVGGEPMLARLVARARRVSGVEQVIVATTEQPADQAILWFAADHGLPAYAGSEDDVLDRFYQTARRYDVSTIVRVTPDCPLLDPVISGHVLARFLEARGSVDYASNTHPPTFPDGLDTEVFSFDALARAWREASEPSEREHVTSYIWRHPEQFRLVNVAHDPDLSALRWTVDEPADLEFVRAVYCHLGAACETAGLDVVLELLRRHPELEAINRSTARNEGYARSVRADRVLTDSKER
ncbi:MAG: glycosyltransferase family protein [candidate division NC10 bacterium]|nr:glycosyltransferase family protein [Candidatus Rokubacteria bacterium]MBI2562908.1 glycosyltransferase family protein [candidate division NC10 bacterium]MBI4629780.1 glycosyltransferase family protein [Candidatus Rokubacteria bacterium]